MLYEVTELRKEDEVHVFLVTLSAVEYGRGSKVFGALEYFTQDWIYPVKFGSR